MNEVRDKQKLKNFGKCLLDIRLKLNLSQDDVAARCDVTKPNLSRIENGEKDLTFTTFLEIARGLNCHPKELLNFDFKT